MWEPLVASIFRDDPLQPIRDQGSAPAAEKPIHERGTERFSYALEHGRLSLVTFTFGETGRLGGKGPRSLADCDSNSHVWHSEQDSSFTCKLEFLFFFSLCSLNDDDEQ